MEKLKDMKFTKSEKKSNNNGLDAGYTNEYPWGLSLNLDDAALKKLGVDELPDAGDLCQIMATGKVTRVAQSASEKDKGSRSVEVQITHLSLESKDTDDESWDKAKKERKERY